MMSNFGALLHQIWQFDLVADLGIDTLTFVHTFNWRQRRKFPLSVKLYNFVSKMKSSLLQLNINQEKANL